MSEVKPRVFAIGETVLDIIFEGSQPVRAVPGGSMLNAAVSLGRTGIHIELISEFGNDPTGNLISSFLENNGVGTSAIFRYDTSKTSIALAFLDSDKKATYTFYHDVPNEIPEMPLPVFTRNDILLFGSFYSIKPERRFHVLRFLNAASSAGSILVYDPNIRKAHPVESAEIRQSITENMILATLVKGSLEDFYAIFGTDIPEQIYERIKAYCPNLIITSGNEDIWLFTPSSRTSIPVPGIEPLSTIGAGDNFNAGVIFGIVRAGLNACNVPSIDLGSWNKIIARGISFATATCLSMENSVPVDFDPGQQTHTYL